jgi:lysophospholipase L1-like esterase
VVRGFAGAQTSHAAGVAVEQTDYIHLNAQGYQVVADAVAEYFSAYEASK